MDLVSYLREKILDFKSWKTQFVGGFFLEIDNSFSPISEYENLLDMDFQFIFTTIQMV